MDEEPVLVYLDFNGKVLNDTFDKDTFIRIANLDKNNPLVQINDTVFKGTYDYAVGTNLFFEENEEAPKRTDIFIKKGPSQFENVFNSNKILNLKPVKVPPQKVQISKDVTKIEFNLNWDYKTILEKFSSGSLRIQDILKDVQVDEIIEEKIDCPEKINIQNQPNPTVDAVKEEYVIDDFEPGIMLEDYQTLRKLAFRPVKTVIEPECIQECDSKFKDAYEYKNLECQILQPCDFFRTEPVNEINEETLTNCVDINRCILYGLINKSTTNPRILTNKEKQKVLTLNNFDNLSLSGRYYVLKNHVEELEEYLKNVNDDERNSRDKYGRTPDKTLKIYKKLTDALKKRIEEIKYSLKSCDENDDNQQAGPSEMN